jgi:hypothetical protein
MNTKQEENNKKDPNELIFALLDLMFNADQIKMEKDIESRVKDAFGKPNETSSIISDRNILGARTPTQPLGSVINQVAKPLNPVGLKVDGKIYSDTPAKQDYYKVVFRNTSIPPLRITKKMYDNMIIDGDFAISVTGKPSQDDLMHGIDGDERLTLRKSEILYIGKV